MSRTLQTFGKWWKKKNVARYVGKHSLNWIFQWNVFFPAKNVIFLKIKVNFTIVSKNIIFDKGAEKKNF